MCSAARVALLLKEAFAVLAEYFEDNVQTSLPGLGAAAFRHVRDYAARQRRQPADRTVLTSRVARESSHHGPRAPSVPTQLPLVHGFRYE